jgi:hypothetical protein
LNSRGLVIVAVVAIAILLVGSTAFSHSAEAKNKESKIKVYVKNIDRINGKLSLNICIADDDSHCHGEKTINLQKASNGGKKSKILAATFKIKFSSNPSDEFGPGDVSACGKLLGADECSYASLKKVKSNNYKATLDYNDLFEKGTVPMTGGCIGDVCD